LGLNATTYDTEKMRRDINIVSYIGTPLLTDFRVKETNRYVVCS